MSKKSKKNNLTTLNNNNKIQGSVKGSDWGERVVSDQVLREEGPCKGQTVKLRIE